MPRALVPLFIVAAITAVSVVASQAQEDKFSYKNGTITFDKKGFKAEFDKMQRELAPKGKKTARSLFKNTYCVDCGGAPTEKLTCRAIAGGRIGKGLCLLGGAATCPEGVASVTEGAC